MPLTEQHQQSAIVAPRETVTAMIPVEDVAVFEGTFVRMKILE